ncbi:MAG: N4-gp56 family major capsid protein [Ruminococcaceae bacterium]|nr:N4-gp56 family major capsid protein [Oscillospiraceae bacterium]
MITKYLFNIQLFAEANVQTTNMAAEGNDLSPSMKEYYDTELLENAKEELFFNQFGKLQNLPAKRGKKISWRKFDTLGPALVPLEEGVTPDGNKINMTSVEAEITEHGDYTTVSDVLDLTAVDDIILGCTEEHGSQAGLTMDTLTRDIVCNEATVMYAPSVVNGVSTPTLDRLLLDKNCKITPSLVNKVVTRLKKNKAPKIDGKYICIIHPSVSEDLRECEGWIEAHKYAAVTEIFNGEIGELHGVRFIETNQAPVYKFAKVWPNYGRMTISAVDTANSRITLRNDKGVSPNFVAGEWMDEKFVMINGVQYIITESTTDRLKLTDMEGNNITAAVGNVGDEVLINTGTAEGLAVFGCIFFGRDAYGRVELSGGAMRMIVKALGSAGSSDPLDQRQTVGWKGFHAAAVLYPERIIRLEVCSSYSEDDEQN